MDIDTSRPALVTGANGYIASWIVKCLLDEGVSVHGTVRDPSNTAKTKHLTRLADGAAGELELFAADLTKAGSFAYPFPKKTLPKFMVWLIGPFVGLERAFISANVGYPWKCDNTRSREQLGIDYRPLEDTLCDHFQQMLDDGFVKKRG